MIDAFDMAPKLGITWQALDKLCEDGRIAGAVERPEGGWDVPDDTVLPVEVVYAPMVRNAIRRIPMTKGLLPSRVVAQRDGLQVDAVNRLCRLGRYPGAEKHRGCWFIPRDAASVAVRRGRPPIDYSEYPDWLNAPLE